MESAVDFDRTFTDFGENHEHNINRKSGTTC